MIENDHHAAASIHKREEIKNASSTQVLLTRPVLRCCFLAPYVPLTAVGSANVPVYKRHF